MPATLIWEKMTRAGEGAPSSGQIPQDALNVRENMEMMSWSSVKEMESLVEKYGVAKNLWPIYRDCEIKSEIPLEEARQRSAGLQIALEKIDPHVVESSYWLSFVYKILRDDNYFYIMV